MYAIYDDIFLFYRADRTMILVCDLKSHFIIEVMHIKATHSGQWLRVFSSSGLLH